MFRILALCLIAMLLVGACSFSGPKGGTPGWKVYKEEHDRPVPQASIRMGAMELRVTRVFLRREHTVLKTVTWTGWIHAQVTSQEQVSMAAFKGVFKVFGRSGRAYDTHVTQVGRGWKLGPSGGHFHLPPNVPGEVGIFVSFESTSDKAPDELGALLVGEQRVEL